MNSAVIREANLQIELMHTELEKSKTECNKILEENIKLKYQFDDERKKHVLTKERLEETEKRLKLLVSAFEPIDKLYKSLISARKSLNLNDFNKRNSST